ncbi:thioester-forming surface-anchored protein [Lactobacillus gallinarum]|uniref:Uncharacterized protein n=1 Tax=Lactobacillus gallinarum DSM 10532 = JCM 2011 TaxID=1423748 RepID=A0A0R1NLZ6_9LACO|nr:thioester-forming surface-anchored protein [Lactobacillus gallinarum]KRL20857.1 hypothetical protein FC37_GL001703 [Lactobacillus gallinarum DSM 10532 = JCM 2011]
MQTRKNAVLLAFMMILTSLLLLVSLSANITHAAEKGSTLNGQTQQFNKGEGNPNSKDSKSDSEKATPSKGTNSEDNSTTQSNQTATVTINKIASDTQKQLAGAHLQIWENDKLVQDFTTTGEASVFNLPKGKYTLKEVSAPKGYDVAKAKPFTVAAENITTTIGTTVRAGTGDTGNKIYIPDSSNEEIVIYGPNGQKDGKLGYCFNARKDAPDPLQYYDHGVSYSRTSIQDGSLVNKYMGKPLKSKDKDSLDAIKTIIWNGFGQNPDNVQKKYGLTDDELYRITQRAIWYYTDSASDDHGKPSLGTLGMPNEANTNVSKEVLQNALEDIIKVDPNSPIPTGMAIDFFIPDKNHKNYQNILAASFTSTSTKPGKPVPVTLVDSKTVPEGTKPTTPEGTKPTKPEGTKPTKPEGTKPTTPEGTKPTKPEGTKPTKPEGTKPTKPEGTKPTTPEDTKPTTPEDTKPTTPEDTKPTTPEVEQPKATTPTTPEVEQPKATTPTTPEVEQPKATEQPSDNTATQKNNDDDFYAIPVKAQTTDKKAKVNHQKAVYKTNNSQKMPKATSVVYTANNSEALPKTGAKQSALIVLIGLGMVVLSGFLYKKEF